MAFPTLTDAEPISARINRYILGESDAELRKLLVVAQVLAPSARTAFARVGIEPGWRTIECGCGPLGGLAVLAEMVGPGGHVVGVDFSEVTVARTRSVLDALSIRNVEVVVGDALDTDAAALGGQFDLAFTRCFLLHQADPLRALTAIANLVRPGGWIVAHEPLREPEPLSHPALSAVPESWRLFHTAIQRLGVPEAGMADLPRLARAAGLEVVELNGFFKLVDAETGFNLHATATAAVRDQATRLGVAVGSAADELVDVLRSAAGRDYDWVTTPFFIDVTLRKPLGPPSTS